MTAELPIPNAAHFLGTHARRMRALEAYPRTLELAMEPSGHHYRFELYRQHVGWATWAMCPWLWFAPDEPLGPLDWE